MKSLILAILGEASVLRISALLAIFESCLL